jgi:cytochrome c peroxidase
VAKGEPLFVEHCARCHGTYGKDAKYPNKIVALDTVGTDRTLSDSITKKNMEHFNKSWFGQQKTPDGNCYAIELTEGYQAPPLDGIWATAPYLHNG